MPNGYGKFAQALVVCMAILALLPGRAWASSGERWLFASDLHFDPFADPKIVERLAASPSERWRAIFASSKMRSFSGYGTDTNFALLESSLDAMKAEAKNPDVIVFSGDFLAHGFQAHFDSAMGTHHDQASYQLFVDKTLAFLADEFGGAFPKAHVLPVLGNNDSYCGDYAGTPGSPFLVNMAHRWAPLVGDVGTPASFAAQFGVGGYYTMALPSEHLQVIVLNDVYWSPKYHNACGDGRADPGGDELTWLGSTLRAMPSDRQAWIVGHIPPGVDVYSTLRSKTIGSVTMMLADRFNDAFVHLLEDPNSRIGLAIAGHTHMNDFRIVGSPTSTYAVPMVIVPSVSPIYFNNPSFLVADINREVARIDDRLGRLKPGFRADLVHIGEDLSVRGTWVAGKQ